MWLTSEKKRSHLDRLAAEIDAGCVDFVMLPWIRDFNALAGIVTVSSCQGHIDDDRDPYLTLRVTRRMALWFLTQAGEIVTENPEFRVELFAVSDPPYDSDIHVRLEGRLGGTQIFLQGLQHLLERMPAWARK